MSCSQKSWLFFKKSEARAIFWKKNYRIRLNQPVPIGYIYADLRFLFFLLNATP